MSTDRMSVLDDRGALEEVLGRGGVADVYRATDLVLGRKVAVKVLREQTTEGAERARFVEEARTLAGLSHPGLTTVLDAGISGVQPYLVMELVDGNSLADCCAGTPMASGTVAAIGAELADALAFAHRAGVVHRDVKPANVLISTDGHAVLTDFGIARLLHHTTGHTRTGHTIGSPHYLAPEQVRAEPITPAVDVYSLGLVLLEALTGERTYAGPPMEAALQRLTTPPVVPSGTPDPWPSLITAMTDLDPAARPTAAEVASRLGATGKPPETSPDATRVLSQPVLPLSGAPATSGAETHVLATPGNDLRRRVAHHAARASALARPQVLLLAALLLAGLVMFVVAALPDAARDDADHSAPTGVPPELEDPLSDLHRAVHGSPR
ncbi:MAG TPA: serine/threonine-protein kinase [Marmoricola sp.]